MPLKDQVKRKEYQKSYVKKHYEKHIDLYKSRSKANNKKSKERNREFVKEHLIKNPCVDCGESDIIVLEFDHVRGKKINDISNMCRMSWSLKKIKDEIEKCEVRCANCHRRVTYKRRIIKH